MRLKYYSMKTAILLFLFFLSSANSYSQNYGQSKIQGLIRVNKNQIQPKQGSLHVDIDIVLNGVEVSPNNQLILTPVLKTESGRSHPLPSILINGKNRDKLYNRSLLLKGKTGENFYRIIKANKTKVVMTIPYKVDVVYEKWMKDAGIYLTGDFCGCGGSEKGHGEMLISKDLGNPTVDYDFVPVVQFIVPPKEDPKERVEPGYAYVVFVVDRWEIVPTLKVGTFDNRIELQKIKNSLDYVRGEPTARIKGISIIAHASPEGTYEHNMMLSKNRAKSLLDYITQQYGIPSSVAISSEGRGENWDDLITYVTEDPKVENKDQVLRIIRSVGIFDGREKQLMDLANGRPYKYMLTNIFPLLRRSDYRIEYTVPAFTVEKGKRLLETKPEMLSLEEMYLIANTYQKGSDEFNHVFDVAVRYFPNDPIANLNAAAAALLKGKLNYAKDILEKYEDEPKAWNNLGVLCMREYRFTEAESYLTEAVKRGSKEAQQNLSLLPELKRAYDDYKREKAGYDEYQK